jgi:hypothetical protein
MGIQSGSWTDHVLAVRFFLKLLAFPKHEIILNSLLQSDFLSNCTAMLESDDFQLVAQILFRFVALWENCLIGALLKLNGMNTLKDERVADGQIKHEESQFASPSRLFRELIVVFAPTRFVF